MQRSAAGVYSRPLLNGRYDVFLHFAEIYPGALSVGARVFDIFMEGNLVADNLDVYKEAGNKGYKAYILSTTDIEVKDGKLTIYFVGVEGNAKINAIEIRPATTPPTTCEPITVDFKTSANGVALSGGTYVSNQWASIGLTLSTIGGLAGENRPRLFNTSDVGNDPDLGTPNERCTPPGPGVGIGGEPSGDGPNCDYLGNVLIIQESDSSITIPDDNVDGGSIVFHFTTDAPYVSEMGLLDIDYETVITITYYDKTDVDPIVMPLKGDNSYQTISINKWNVKQLKVDFARSGAVTFISFCPAPTPPPPTPPTPPPPTPPTPTPPTPPTPTPPTPPTPTPPTAERRSVSAKCRRC
jgi:hypothetical protein